MKIGFIGLGKMGNQIVAKLIEDRHEVVVYDVDHVAVDACKTLGAVPAKDRQDLVQLLGEQPVVWVMIPAQYVTDELNALIEILPAGSTLIDGGNTNFLKTLTHAEKAKAQSINFVDVGTSGGIRGLANGFCLMAGGSAESISLLRPIFNTLTAPTGQYVHTGAEGSGHYVKMVHNGIEYSLMQSYAEGYDLLKYGPVHGLDLAAIARTWQGGSIVASNLNSLIAELLVENPELEGIDGYVADSGEGKWAYETAEASNIKMPALKEALAVRHASQQGYHIFATKLLAGLRNKFGGHKINK